MSATLLFPGGMQPAIDYLTAAKDERIIGASSVANDPAMPSYKEWLYLPFITDEGFDLRFGEAVKRHGITRVFTAHPVISRYLKALAEKQFPAIEIAGTSFEDTQTKPHKELMSRIARAQSERLIVEEGGKPFPDTLFMASLIKHALRIEGQSDETKLWAMAEILRLCPQGDVVEIGSGRSAFVLSQLARHYGIGNFLSVDPWEVEHNIQQEVPDAVNQESRAIDFDVILEVYKTNLLPYNAGHINYLRLPSDDAFLRYSAAPLTMESEFGATAYTGRIACLHIDGNHDFERAESDLAHWTTRLLPGAWVIVDDYVWCFGTGPRRAADAFLHTHRSRIACAFVIGSALFMRLT